MRIRDLHIEGFGRFADWRRGPFERPVTLFRGNNEAGKSTLLEFIRRLLFGFPANVGAVNPYPPLDGGRHGGRLTLVSEAGEAVVVERFKGAGGGLRLTDPNGATLPNAELQRLLGHHTQAVFQSVFAFTLDELHDEALLNDDQVNSQIYSAGMGADNLPKALKTLNDEKRALFLQGGRRHKIYDLAEELNPIDDALSNVEENAQNYRCLSDQLGAIKAELKALNNRDQDNKAQLAQQDLLENAWPSWNDLHEAERELSLVPAIDNFPADGVNRLDVLEDRVRTAQQEYNSSEDAVETARNQAEVSIEHESILDYASKLDRLQQGLTSFANDIHDLPQRQAELRQQENALTETLRDLGPDWNEERLESFDLSLVVREQISRQADGLQEAERQLEGCRATLAQDHRLLEESVTAQQAAQSNLDAAPSPAIDQEQIGQRRVALRQMQSWLTKINAIEARASDLQAQLDGIEMPAMPKERQKGGLAVSIVAFFIGLAFLAGGAALGDAALFMGIVAGVVLICVAAYLFLSRKSWVQRPAESPLAAPIRESLRKAEADLQRLRSALAQEAEPFHLEVVDDAALRAAEDMVNAAEVQLRERASRTEALGQATRLAGNRRNQEKQSREAVEQAEAILQNSKANWRAWLAERHLPEDFLPATIGELRGKVDLGKIQLRTLQGSRAQIDATQGSIDQYVSDAEQLAVKFGLAIDRNDLHTAATAVHQLVDLRNLRVGLEQRKSEALSRLQHLSGPGQPLEELKERLAQTNLPAIQEQKHRLDQESQEINQRIQGLAEQRGSTQTQLDQLIGEEESSKLRTESHRIVEAMRGHARAWTVRTVAENLLKEAQAKFERERQPGVLLDAQNFFRNITGGRYERVFSPLGQQEIRVAGPDGHIKQPNELSRGTREQLFLSLRFGLIRELGQRSEPQPVILDDALVNFDPRRGKKAAGAFLDLAKTNQVLVFTCHPQIVEWFNEAAESKGAEPPEIIDIE